MQKRLSYEEFLEKTVTKERCPLCGFHYFEHVGTGLEYLCRKERKY